VHERYSRQIRFAPLGEAGQERLIHATVAIVGCGALGSFQAGALARAGIGRLILIDRDYVEWSNLQRQWLFEESDAEQALPKAAAAARRLRAINSAIHIDAHVADLDAASAADLLEGSSLILDGTDNFETRYLINDYALERRVPWIYGGAVGAYGLVMPIVPGKSACFECMFPEAPSGAQPTCETAGVLNSITSLVASWQVSLAYRLLATGEVDARITTIDAWAGTVRHVSMPGPCAGHGGRHLRGEGRAPISLCGRNAVQIHERRRPVDLVELRSRLEPLGEVRANEFALRFAIAPYEMTIFPDGRAIIKGTTDPGLARSLYARYLGN